MSTTATILSIWLLANLSVVALLVVTNAVAEYRRLGHEGIPQPARNIWKRIIGALLMAIPGSPGPWDWQELQGRSVWLAWDSRWYAAGDTLATIEEVHQEGSEATLLLRTASPISLTAAATFSRVRFYPARPASRWRVVYGAVRGTVRPPDSNRYDATTSHEGAATGVVVLLSADAV